MALCVDTYPDVILLVFTVCYATVVVCLGAVGSSALMLIDVAMSESRGLGWLFVSLAIALIAISAFAYVVKRSAVARSEIRRLRHEAQLLRNTIDQFAHESATPLAELRLHCGTLSHQLPSDPLTQAFADRIKKGVEAISVLIDWLERSHGDRGAPQPLFIDLTQVCDFVLLALKIQHALDGIRIDRDYARGLPCRADRSQLEQAIRSLLKNAIEASESSDRPAIGLRTARDMRGWAMLEIADNGPGIEAHVLPTLGRNRVSTKPGPGRGHGVLSAATTIRELGGELRITNRVDGKSGAIARLVLPSSGASERPILAT